ncbi:MAG TPA: tetratricopeptide repeat protein [Candidatus Sulfotelmatobacter sp.]|nr:tetratricopeptide repeat protein [Candidatus Sulfotelmatobacter sp.]
METSQQFSKTWNNAQTYGMAAVCLVLGIVAGYLLHAPVVVTTEATASTVSPSPNAPAQNAAPAMPSAEDMKRMADKQVAPLLADLQKNPKDADLLAKIARAYMAAQQYQSAQQYYEQSATVKADPENLNELAFVYVKLGDVDRGIAALQRAIAIDPKNPAVLFNLGFYEWKGKADPQAAVAAWEALLKADPKNPKRAQIEQMLAQAKKHLSIAPGTKTEKPAL